METSGTERGPVQSVASVHFLHRSPEREKHFAAQAERSSVDAADFPGVTARLPVLVQEPRLSLHTRLPFAAQQIAQETPFSPAASGPHQHRKGALAYQKVETSGLPFSPSFVPLSVRA